MEKNEVFILIKGDNGREYCVVVSVELLLLLFFVKRNIVESIELEVILVGKSLCKKY